MFKSRAVITISLKNISHNIGLLRLRSPLSKLLVMVKADGYGHSAENIIKLLQPTDGVAVARFDEAIKLREQFLNLKILLLTGFLDQAELELISKYSLDVVVFDQQQLDILQTVKLENPISIWLKIDIGMKRLGFENEINHVAAELKANINVAEVLLMGHLSSADDLNSQVTLNQIEQFDFIARPLQYATSLANSAGILYWPKSHKDWNRPGLAVYGVNPSPNIDVDLRPAMVFQGMIIAFKHVNKGQRLGYGLSFTASKDLLIAIVSVGYGDGLPRCSGNKNRVWIKGTFHSLIGRISMDSSYVDVTERKDLVLGDRVEFWGEHVPVEEVAYNVGTIPYELLVGLTSRVKVEFTN
jgi:alanine racemase